MAREFLEEANRGIWLEGKSLADKIKEEVRERVAYYKEKARQVPGLIGILVGDNPSSQIYLRTKENTSRRLGINSEILTFPATVETRELCAKIEELNSREDVDGILVQLPLPPSLNAHDVICSILPEKDVDGFHPFSLGNLLMNQPGLRSCTPLGVVELLKFNNTAIEGRDAVVIAHVAARADILIAAMGRAAFVGPEFVKEGATVIDVGINSVSDRALVEKLFGRDPKREMDLEQKGYTLVGDVDPRVIEKAAFLTPVPGGVGLLTVAMLMRNTLEAFRRRRSLG